MMSRKFKKALFSIVSAVLCVTMVLGVSASAAEKSVWSETKALTSAKYNSKYINWLEKYSEKESKNTVSFGKSRTKKFYEKQLVELDDKNPQFVVNIIDKETIVSVAYKNKKIKTVAYEDGTGIAIYIDPDNMTMLSVADKQKITMPMTEDIGYEDMLNEMTEAFVSFDNESYMSDDLGVTDKTKGKLFKIKSGEKIYYYEEFKGSEAGKFAFLFDANGNPLAMTSDGMSVCFNVSFSVKDSEFSIPKGYTEMEY
ncbi:MAG: hypothetical protein NC395_11680 [Prevotella sp.]|nr:hypothetical protein [Prevotella sp.]